ncbi:Protein-tyrosine phosphatase, low molecular weight [Anaeromyxobacter dehalogenans 2CP-1]|uniref:Protein-tyrosine phosphatase, low molecular weight n=1 Tax=Anaeromyxobacter dehalogenans (strain ATCC BAA-258 / DSM 21875 / 2CP-1) TaxID=455488 RepID=B8JF76_ANAD2|nr:arsenic resistance N-acetyltransferase ArsN2 [Anaeromyxobacter dehalogenans]ACL64433.1 Protein-tyrosine phosphatase, low molecular weight [Anaeromyxobacter dehalogenans 2CP-1]
MSADAAWQEEAARLRAAPPRHLLFLCVANSARSQMAEGIARALAPASTRISSAGSRPTQVNPLAVAALAEIGIEISGQRSKGLQEIAPDVDAVITLCQEEVCPVWLGKAMRLHWGLPDPAAQAGDEPARLEAFRRVRDELRTRLAAVFRQPDGDAIRYGPATPEELGAVRALLERLHLPAADVGAPHQTFLVARSGADVVGCVALERYGEDALLRSLGVVPRLQGSGVGKALHAEAIAEAERQGVRALYLLTTTAARFFARAGFSRIDRASVPAALAASTEFRSLCPAAAVCMVKHLPR